MKRISKEEFTENWCKRSGVSKAKLAEFGQTVIECDCDYEYCEGWAVTSIELEALLKELREDYGADAVTQGEERVDSY